MAHTFYEHCIVLLQVREWVESSEFERLRAEVNLQDVKSISCACVCRILPENEEEYIAANKRDTSNITSIFAIPEELDEEQDGYDYPDYNGLNHDLGPESWRESVDGDVPFYSGRPKLMISPSGENLCIETDSGEKIDDDDDNVFQFVAPRGASGGRCKITEEGVGDIQLQHEFDPYTQIWLCGRDQRKGLLQIFTYNDNNVGQYVSPTSEGS